MEESGSLKLKWVQGFTDKNIAFLDARTVCYSCGNHICFLNLESKEQSAFENPGRGLGVLTANGTRGIFAFSEQKLSPSIFVYNFPDLQLINELKGEAKVGYTSLTLSNDGPYLGCLSSFPDYTITVWNWENAEEICSKLQAGQDVISLVFNPLNWLQLCTLGATTLTLWNIERSDSFHVLKPRVVDLSATIGSFVEKLPHTSHDVSNQLSSETVLTSRSVGATVTPSAVCWTSTSELYVGCEEGYLFLVDPESIYVSVLFNPTAVDAIPELKRINFQSLSLYENDLIATGKENRMYCLQISGTQANITKTLQLETPVTAVRLSPDNETVILSSKTGQIYEVNPSKSDKLEKVLNVLSGDFLAAAFLHGDSNSCVSLRENGVLQLWSSDGACLSSLPLQAEVTSLSCCPIAHYAAVGTATGRVLFIDLNNEKQPRMVHQVYLCNTAVDHLVFDQEGHYLLVSGSDSHLYVIDAKPSTKFAVIGYTVLSGHILCLSTQSFSSHEEVKVLALCSEQEGENKDGRLIIVFSLPARNITGPDCVDRYGCLSAHMLKMLKYEVPLPLTSCSLGDSQVFAYCQKNKSLQLFELPKSTEDLSDQQVVQLKPVQKVKGHPLGPASLVLSPHLLWLASLGRDGLLRIRKTTSLDEYTELRCHSCHPDGGQSVSFSADGLTLLTSGFNDGSLVCADYRINVDDVDDDDMKDALQYSRSVALTLQLVFNYENPVLMNFPVWSQKSPDGSEKTEEHQVRGGTCLDVIEEEASHSYLTWLESKHEAVLKEDNEQYAETKNRLRETVGELRNVIQKLIRDNENLPLEQFNLDVEEQLRLEERVEREAEKVRAEIERDIMEKCYICDVLKRESWNSWMVKRRAIKAFHSDLVMWNYPLKERTDEELEDLRRVQNMRKLEEKACTLSGVKQEDEGRQADSAALKGSLSAQLGYSNPYIYDQFCLQTSEQRINQIILLRDLIYSIKMSFNTEFDALHRQKVQELKRIKSRNKQIREMMQELDINQDLWEPSLSDSEWPERLFTVDDSEIKAEKYLTPEQRKEEERRKLEEEHHLAAQRDDGRERGLDDMMDGVLEVKKGDILKVEIPPPKFALTKPDTQWSEEEKKVYKHYEKKTKELNEEKEQYKKFLETEMKKLQESTKDAVEKFDEALIKLLRKKVNCTAAIDQEELKISRLADSVFTGEEMKTEEQELKLKLEKILAHKSEIGKIVKDQEQEVFMVQKDYERMVNEEKNFERNFRREFFNVPNQLVDQLYKLFRRRPRVHKMRVQTEKPFSLLKDTRQSACQSTDTLNQMPWMGYGGAMDELDAPEYMPKGLNPSTWERFCLLRRDKIEFEQKVKKMALALAEMQAFLQRRRDDDEAAHQECKRLSEALESLHKKRNDHLVNTTVQVLLKQGQVEALTPDLTADNTDTDFILCEKSRVETIRRHIRVLAKKKLTTMGERKEVLKRIVHLEWEHKVIKKKTEDLKDKERDVKMLRLTDEQREVKYLSKVDQQQRIAQRISSLEKNIDFMKTTHQKVVQQYMKKIEQLNKQVAKKEKNTSNLQQELPEVKATVANLSDICEATATGETTTKEENYQKIVQEKNLEDLARSQAEDLDILWEEVERLRKKNFPFFD